jgi:hypothetical protein
VPVSYDAVEESSSGYEKKQNRGQQKKVDSGYAFASLKALLETKTKIAKNTRLRVLSLKFAMQ